MRYRVKLVPSVDGSVLAVVQVRWLGLFWRDYDALSNNLHKKYWELMGVYRKLHQLEKEIVSEEEDVNSRVQEVKRYGDPLRAIGPVWDDPDKMPWFQRLPIFVKRHRFVAPPDKATLDKVRKAIQGGTYTDPDDLGIKWPPSDRGVAATGGKRSAFVLAKHYMDALVGGIVKTGEPYDHVVKYHKPDQQQNRNNQKQQQKQQNQQQNQNQGKNQGNQ